MTVTCAESLRWGKTYLQACGIETARLDAEVLLMHCLRWERTALYCERDYQLTPDEDARFHELVRRRGAHEPIAYLTGEREFWSLPLAVRPGVLIPRPDTEWVVEAALRYAPQLLRPHSRCHVLDIGTGSGNIAIAVATSLALVDVTAIDSSLEALAVAQLNAQSCHVAERVHFVCGDLFSPLHAAVYASICSFPIRPISLPRSGTRCRPQSAVMSRVRLSMVATMVWYFIAVYLPKDRPISQSMASRSSKWGIARRAMCRAC